MSVGHGEKLDMVNSILDGEAVVEDLCSFSDQKFASDLLIPAYENSNYDNSKKELYVSTKEVREYGLNALQNRNAREELEFQSLKAPALEKIPRFIKKCYDTVRTPYSLGKRTGRSLGPENNPVIENMEAYVGKAEKPLNIGILSFYGAALGSYVATGDLSTSMAFLGAALSGEGAYQFTKGTIDGNKSSLTKAKLDQINEGLGDFEVVATDIYD